MSWPGRSQISQTSPSAAEDGGSAVAGAEGSPFAFFDDFFCDLASFSFSRSISRSRSSYKHMEKVIDRLKPAEQIKSTSRYI